jgi:hypothetical protein
MQKTKTENQLFCFNNFNGIYMKSKTTKKYEASGKINDFLNENLGLPAGGQKSRLKAQVLFSLPTGSFIKEALDFRLNDPEITEITLWKVCSNKVSM